MNWIKLSVDGVKKRIYDTPRELDHLIELAKMRFGVLKYILATGQFKPYVSFKSPAISKNIYLETNRDLIEHCEIVLAEQKTVNLKITFKRIGLDDRSLVPFRLVKQILMAEKSIYNND